MFECQLRLGRTLEEHPHRGRQIPMLRESIQATRDLTLKFVKVLVRLRCKGLGELAHGGRVDGEPSKSGGVWRVVCVDRLLDPPEHFGDVADAHEEPDCGERVDAACCEGLEASGQTLPDHGGRERLQNLLQRREQREHRLAGGASVLEPAELATEEGRAVEAHRHLRGDLECRKRGEQLGRVLGQLHLRRGAAQEHQVGFRQQGARPIPSRHPCEVVDAEHKTEPRAGLLQLGEVRCQVPN
mmetsp:Transcript_14935/g.52432  ORF Transcript_14935/g.52432 Transcript_14935/m.52432 type:complete len:242 (+) Transcript_14935:101-826(+)